MGGGRTVPAGALYWTGDCEVMTGSSQTARNGMMKREGFSRAIDVLPSRLTNRGQAHPDIEELYVAHRESLFKFLFRLTGDRSAAEDALHEAFLRLAQKPPRRRDNLRAWLFTVAANVARDGIRADGRRHKLLSAGADRVPIADPPEKPDRAVERSEVEQLVWSLLDVATPKERTVLLMREEGFTHREIAGAVGTTTKSVGTIIARALRKLARRLARESEDT